MRYDSVGTVMPLDSAHVGMMVDSSVQALAVVSQICSAETLRHSHRLETAVTVLC